MGINIIVFVIYSNIYKYYVTIAIAYHFYKPILISSISIISVNIYIWKLLMYS